jgi:hypothetical protein
MDFLQFVYPSPFFFPDSYLPIVSMLLSCFMPKRESNNWEHAWLPNNTLQMEAHTSN